MNFIVVTKRPKTIAPSCITTRNLKRLNKDIFTKRLNSLPWNVIEIFDDINDCWHAWKILFNSVTDELCPLKRIRPRRKTCPWFTCEIETLKVLRDQLQNRAILTNNPNDWSKWRRCKNKVTAACRKAKADFIKTAIKENKSDSRAIWRALRTLMPKCKSQGIQALEINGKTVTSPIEIANSFNSFFINIGEKLANLIPRSNRTAIDYLESFISRLSSNFSFTPIKIEETEKLLCNLPTNKATGLDNYQASLLKLAAIPIAPSLTWIFNHSLNTGQFPDEWKQAKITAIHKKGPKVDTGNYRPISVLPVISKLIEKIVHQQLYKYLDDNKLLCTAQSGFRKKFSTQTSLHRLSESILDALNSSKITGLVAIDIRKAFDTVNHVTLLKKLEHYGVRHTSLKWFKDYLKDRTQVSDINGTRSQPGYVRTGVPQGSTLGPLLFILYINDLPSCFKHCSVNMYADDTAFYYSNREKQPVTDAINEDITNVYLWLCANKLSMHVGKTNTLLICNYQKIRHLDSTSLNINLNEQDVTQTDSLKYLGIDIDNRFNFDVYIDNLIKKLNKSVGLLKRNASCLPLQTRKMLYNTLILPNLDYCSTVWDNASKQAVVRLQRLQNRALRIILRKGPRTHIEDMLNSIKWMSVKQRLDYNKCVLMWRIVNNTAPPYLRENFTYASESHDYETQASSTKKLSIKRGHKTSLTVTGARLWNSLPIELRETKVLETFKKKLYKHLILKTEKF